MASTISDATIEEIRSRILAVTKPDRIILFGSAATGSMTPDSDIDLLVVEKEPDVRRESARLQEALRGIGYPVDVVVISTEWFEESKGVVGGIAYPAHKYGKVIHAVA